MIENTVYIAGKITGDPEYKSKFEGARLALENAGCVVMSPAVLPSGFEYESYLSISAEMLKACAQVCFLPDWRESGGAVREMGLAVALGKSVFYFEDWQRTRPQERCEGVRDNAEC